MDKTFLSIKLVIFSVISGKLKVFLPGNKLPAGSLAENKSLDKSAEIIFKKGLQLSLADIYFEQLYTFSSSKPPEITVVYYFLVPEQKTYSNNMIWCEIDSIKANQIDREITTYALQRLRWKIEYTNAVYSFLPDEFTFSQLQTVYESILGKALDKRNFRKKMLSLNILKDTGHVKNLGKARPAEMFSFKKRQLTFVEIL